MNRLQLKAMRLLTASQAIPITFAYTCRGNFCMNSGFRFLWAVLAFCTFAASSSIHRAGAEDVASVGPDVEKYNVVWDSPSENSFGSMPLGNGDIGLNVWVENNGHLLLYIAKVDALDSKQLGPKLGRVRMRMEPPLPLETKFRQTLSLLDASVL